MQATLKKYFWTVNLVVVAAGAGFAAMATNHCLEAAYLSDGAEAQKPKPVAVRAPAVPEQQRSKRGAPLAERNMFCSTCQPAGAEPIVDEGPMVDSVTPPATALPLRLIATHVAYREARSLATIHNTS
jgi:hypothetical protein